MLTGGPGRNRTAVRSTFLSTSYSNKIIYFRKLPDPDAIIHARLFFVKNSPIVYSSLSLLCGMKESTPSFAWSVSMPANTIFSFSSFVKRFNTTSLSKQFTVYVTLVSLLCAETKVENAISTAQSRVFILCLKYIDEYCIIF